MVDEERTNRTPDIKRMASKWRARRGDTNDTNGVVQMSTSFRRQGGRRQGRAVRRSQKDEPTVKQAVVRRTMFIDMFVHVFSTLDKTVKAVIR